MSEQELKPLTERDLLIGMFDSYYKLRKFGWASIVYCPKDGTVFEAIEPGSSGVHDCIYSGEWPNGHWWILADGDMWPSHPILWRAKQEARAKPEGE